MLSRQWANEIADKYESGEWGWTQGAECSWENDIQCFCLTGAIKASAGVKYERCRDHRIGEDGCGFYSHTIETPDQAYLWRERVRSVDSVISCSWYSSPVGRVIQFNDRPTRTKRDVINKLREFANGDR